MWYVKVKVIISDFNCISYHTFCWTFHFSLIEYQQCKPGYTGNQCASCESEDLIVSGTNGFVDDNGQGVKCSKSLFQIKSQNW